MNNGVIATLSVGGGEARLPERGKVVNGLCLSLAVRAFPPGGEAGQKPQDVPRKLPRTARAVPAFLWSPRQRLGGEAPDRRSPRCLRRESLCALYTTHPWEVLRRGLVCLLCCASHHRRTFCSRWLFAKEQCCGVVGTLELERMYARYRRAVWDGEHYVVVVSFCGHCLR